KILEEVGGRAYLASLASSVSTAANAQHYAEIVREKSIHRGLIRLAMEIQRGAFDEEPAEGIVSDAVHRLLGLSTGRDESAMRHVRDVGSKLLEALSRREPAVRGVPYGLLDVDHLLDGLKPGLS